LLIETMKFLSKFRWVMVVIILALCSAPAFAQGCAMCRANAKATPKEGQRALNRAIFVMLAPPVGIMVFGAGFVVRYVRRRDRENEDSN
jgi:heme/copper-type cytochrome/quinol oxidase subunit 2